MVDLTVTEFGRIDYSINAAGVSFVEVVHITADNLFSQLGASSLLPTSDLDIENFDALLKVNTRGVMLCVRAVSKVMISQLPRSYKGRHGRERTLGRGCIVNIGSPHMMAYVASKHALLGITKVACKLFDSSTSSVFR